MACDYNFKGVSAVEQRWKQTIDRTDLDDKFSWRCHGDDVRCGTYFVFSTLLLRAAERVSTKKWKAVLWIRWGRRRAKRQPASFALPFLVENQLHLLSRSTTAEGLLRTSFVTRQWKTTSITHQMSPKSHCSKAKATDSHADFHHSPLSVRNLKVDKWFFEFSARTVER